MGKEKAGQKAGDKQVNKEVKAAWRQVNKEIKVAWKEDISR